MNIICIDVKIINKNVFCMLSEHEWTDTNKILILFIISLLIIFFIIFIDFYALQRFPWISPTNFNPMQQRLKQQVNPSLQYPTSSHFLHSEIYSPLLYLISYSRARLSCTIVSLLSSYSISSIFYFNIVINACGILHFYI